MRGGIFEQEGISEKQEHATIIMEGQSEWMSEKQEERVEFAHNLQLLVEAAWGEKPALAMLSEILITKAGGPIWGNPLFQERKEEVLR